MTASQLILLGLVVIAAVVAGYFIGRWAADRDYGARAARPTPLPAPGDDEIAFPTEASETAPQSSRPRRGAPPPASAGGEHGTAPTPEPRQRTTSAPPPASAGGAAAGSGDEAAAPRRARRGPPPPASAGLLGGDGRKS